jgi:hypothetical protein
MQIEITPNECEIWNIFYIPLTVSFYTSVTPRVLEKSPFFKFECRHPSRHNLEFKNFFRALKNSSTAQIKKSREVRYGILITNLKKERLFLICFSQDGKTAWIEGSKVDTHNGVWVSMENDDLFNWIKSFCNRYFDVMTKNK